MSNRISHIVAYRKADGAIGYENQLLFRLAHDMLHFRRTTRDHVVVMGRKTWESIGRALPDRVNVVVSRTVTNPLPNCVVFANLQSAMDWCLATHATKHVFIIGGAELYRQTATIVGRVIATEIDAPVDGQHADAFYDIGTLAMLTKVEGDVIHDTDQPITYRVVVYQTE